MSKVDYRNKVEPKCHVS